MQQRSTIEKLVGEVLDGTELKLKVDSLRLEENLESGEATIHCDVHHERTGDQNTIAGKGVGIVDAFFHGLVDLYSAEFPSLTSIRFSDFSVTAALETGKIAARSDSTAEVTLRVANSEGREYAFQDSSPSMTRSAVSVVLAAAEFFINSERAYIAVHKAMEHAKAENRPDSVTRYTRQLMILVEATSYSDVVHPTDDDA